VQFTVKQQPIVGRRSAFGQSSQTPQWRLHHTPTPAPPGAPPENVPAAEKPASSTAPQPIQVVFTFHAPAAKQVFLSGDFNQWSTTATPLRRREDGRWERALALSPGRYEYKYVVDGVWTHDPEAKETVCHPHGWLNSAVEVPG
jgi:hypothetical protein